MKSVSDIKIILYAESEKSNPLVKKFSSIQTAEKISFTSEEHLGEIIQIIKEKHESKEIVILKKFMGRFFQMCPGSPGMICCNYRLINTGFNCLYDCTYCYLQSYLNSFGIVVFTNMEDVLRELDRFLENEAEKDKIYRIGTGEFTDSLMIEEITGFGKLLIEKLSGYSNIFLELKTKSSNVNKLLPIENKGNAVIAWSMNTDYNIELYEKGSASLDSRIDAAGKAVKNGFFAAFHFDPVIVYENWRNDYAEVIRKIFKTVDHNKVVWISLGGVRFTSDFPEIMTSNFPEEKITSEEFYQASDNKMRYFKPFRKEIYLFLRNEILKYTDMPYIYMCMETDYMWQDVFGLDFKENTEFENHFGRYLKEKFILKNNRK
ncbi:MAG: hypothetical protein JW982_14375 [Spirochaetes bacterium]|nr:hypothetical protein [Spirochaetota bacterium]